ncbi:MAG: peroxiredoxin [Bdellovibrionales bacterium]
MHMQVGERFIDFSLPNQNGEVMHLKDLEGHWVVLFVYPKDDTPGCTIDSKAFSAKNEEFERRGVKVLGLSADGVPSHKEFCNKYDLKVDLLSDPDGHLLNALGVGQTEFQGNKYWNRTTFLIDGEGMLRKIYTQVDPNGHEEEILAALNVLKNG